MTREFHDVLITHSTLGSPATGPATVAFKSQQLELGSAGVHYDRIVACRLKGTAVRIERRAPDGVIELETADATAFARRLAERVCVLPEVTLAMRSLGSRRGGPPGDHDRFFGPLLKARAEAERAKTPRARVRAFDVASLTAAAESTIVALATERESKSAPHRRALEAQLREYWEPLHTRLQALAAAAAPLSHEPPDDTVAAWCRWSAELRAMFEEADRFWERLRRHLDARKASGVTRGAAGPSRGVSR